MNIHKCRPSFTPQIILHLFYILSTPSFFHNQFIIRNYPPARQFVEYFIKKWPQKRIFKTFNLEKNNRQTYCKQAVIWCVMSIIYTKKRVLNDKRHHFACLPTCLCPAKAYTLGTSSNAFGRKAHDFREPIIGENS